jgi:hypothetical protein
MLGGVEPDKVGFYPYRYWGGATRWSTNTTDRIGRRIDCYRVGALNDSFVRQATTTSQMIHASMRT